jgi:hypothetical protein
MAQFIYFQWRTIPSLIIVALIGFLVGSLALLGDHPYPRIKPRVSIPTAIRKMEMNGKIHGS